MAGGFVSTDRCSSHKANTHTRTHTPTHELQTTPLLNEEESSQPGFDFSTHQIRIKNLRIGYSGPVVPNETARGSLSPHLAPSQMEVGPDLWHPRRMRYLGLVVRPPSQPKARQHFALYCVTPATLVKSPHLRRGGSVVGFYEVISKINWS